ncbi:hypothetical protein GCM10022222_66490 [Amycolatopsis ultiminotia]|uniref:Uncharacterized protein n=1 Tax=Amycolatopsis ultiminotia TaxID=543629 RepID=A0ABP6XUV2_9PSEU
MGGPFRLERVEWAGRSGWSGSGGPVALGGACRVGRSHRVGWGEWAGCAGWVVGEVLGWVGVLVWHAGGYDRVQRAD